MRIRVKLFAVARQLVQRDHVDIELAPPATLADIRRRLGETAPELEPILGHALFALGTEYIAEHTKISSDSELACIPPVSGG